MTKDNATTVHFIYKKETPGTWVYQEVDEKGLERKASNGGVVGSLYIRKSAMGNQPAKKLQVAITPV